jgi:hypothetical protein
VYERAKGPWTNGAAILKVCMQFSGPTKTACMLGENCKVLQISANFWGMTLRKSIP